MGRGRAKAKQTKVARELKYSSPTMDLDALQREIGSGTRTADKEPEVDVLRRPVRRVHRRRRGRDAAALNGPATVTEA
jgi:hypothetical protein